MHYISAMNNDLTMVVFRFIECNYTKCPKYFTVSFCFRDRGRLIWLVVTQV